MNSQSHFTINNKGRIEELEDLLDTVSYIQFSDNFWQEEEWVEEARDAVRMLIVKAFQLGYAANQLPQKNVFDIDFYLQCRSAKQALLTELKEWRLNQLPQSNVKKLPPFSSESIEEAFQRANDLVTEAEETLKRCMEELADKGA